MCSMYTFSKCRLPPRELLIVCLLCGRHCAWHKISVKMTHTNDTSSVKSREWRKDRHTATGVASWEKMKAACSGGAAPTRASSSEPPCFYHVQHNGTGQIVWVGGLRRLIGVLLCQFSWVWALELLICLSWVQLSGPATEQNKTKWK